MAIRERKDCKQNPWEVYWNNPYTGKRQRKSFSTKAEAKKYDSLVKHQLKYEKEQFQPDDTDEQEADVSTTLRSVYLLYLKQKAFSKKSLQWQLDCMGSILKRIGNMEIGKIARQDILTMLNADLQTTVKPVTVRNRFSVLRTVMRWAADNGFRGPVDFPKLPSAIYEKFVPPTTEELAAIMSVASPHIKRVIILGAQCGVRVGPSELLKLTWNDVDLPRKTLRVHGSRKNAQAPWREVPIRDSLIPVFTQWKAEDEAVGATHLINYRGKAVACIDIAFRRTVKKAGIGRRIRPYDLRHAFATEAIAAGIDVGTVARLMGHSSPAMIFNHYQFVMDGQKRSAVEALPDIQYETDAQ